MYWLFTHLFVQAQIKQDSKAGLCEGNPRVAGEFPAQRASNVENICIRWCHNISIHNCHNFDRYQTVTKREPCGILELNRARSIEGIGRPIVTSSTQPTTTKNRRTVSITNHHKWKFIDIYWCTARQPICTQYSCFVGFRCGVVPVNFTDVT